MTPHFRFDNRTQLLKIIPEPNDSSSFLGVVGCYIEQPIKVLVQERWVQKYALALTKIAVGNIRSKFSGTTLFGGGGVNGSDLLSQGISEKEKLEQELMNNYQDVAPPAWFIG